LQFLTSCNSRKLADQDRSGLASGVSGPAARQAKIICEQDEQPRQSRARQRQEQTQPWWHARNKAMHLMAEFSPVCHTTGISPAAAAATPLPLPPRAGYTLSSPQLPVYLSLTRSTLLRRLKTPRRRPSIPPRRRPPAAAAP
jgi:hypothetical protein